MDTRGLMWDLSPASTLLAPGEILNFSTGRTRACMCTLWPADAPIFSFHSRPSLGKNPVHIRQINRQFNNLITQKFVPEVCVHARRHFMSARRETLFCTNMRALFCPLMELPSRHSVGGSGCNESMETWQAQEKMHIDSHANDYEGCCLVLNRTVCIHSLFLFAASFAHFWQHCRAGLPVRASSVPRELVLRGQRLLGQGQARGNSLPTPERSPGADSLCVLWPYLRSTLHTHAPAPVSKTLPHFSSSLSYPVFRPHTLTPVLHNCTPPPPRPSLPPGIMKIVTQLLDSTLCARPPLCSWLTPASLEG